MIKLQSVILATGMILLPFTAFAQAAASPAVQTPSVLAPGVAYENFALAEGPLNYNIIRVNVEHPGITLETESGHDRLFKGEKVLDSVTREAEPGKTRILAGINGDFWTSQKKLYMPVGLLVADGMIYTMPSPKRSAFLFTADETPYIGKVTMKVGLKTRNETIAISSINPEVLSPDKTSLFTTPYGAKVAPGKGKRYILTMEQAEFLPNQPVDVSIREVPAGSETTLTTGSLVLHIPPGTSTSRVTAGMGQLSARIPQVKGVVRSACGGGPVMVQNGKVDIRAKEEGISQNFVNARHPRTAIGYSKDRKNVFMVTLDGRQPKVSVGGSIPELAEFMVKLGCWSAMNLDGGGSTSMVVGGKVVNKPSDLKGARTVANSILVVEMETTASRVSQPVNSRN